MKQHFRFAKRAAVHVLRRMPVIKQHHRFRQQIDLTTEAAGLIGKSRARSALASMVLSARLRWLGIDLSRLPQEIRSDLLLVVGDQCVGEDDVHALEDRLKALPSSSLPCQQWLRLNELFCFRGRYPLAQVCREHARQLALQPISKPHARPPISWTNSLAAALEGGECTDQDRLQQILERAGIQGIEARKWHLLLTILSGDHVPKDLLLEFDDTGYATFVNNKNVAIVGPASTQASDATDIDASDVVIRLNHSFSGKGTDPLHKGTRTHVSCFNGEQTTAFIAGHDGELPAEVTWACFKGDKRAMDVQARNADKHCRSLVMFDGMTFHGSYNMIPVVAMDMSVCNCRAVKIFHTDLMLTVRRYKGYYPDSFRREEPGRLQAICRSTVYHDPVLQYRILNKLWGNKKFAGDERFENVMIMGLDAYLRELEQVYAAKISDFSGAKLQAEGSGLPA